MALFFQRDASLTVYPETSAGTFANGDTAYVIPLLEGFSFSQTTNSSEITLSEMESTGGVSRRGRKMFNDSLAPVEWSFSTYLRPFLSGSSGSSSTYAAAGQHLVDEVLWNALMAKGRLGEVSTEIESVTLTRGSSVFSTAPTVAFSGGGGSGATAEAILFPTGHADAGKISHINVTAGGSGYSSAPTVVFTGNPSSGSGHSGVAVVGDSDDALLSRGTAAGNADANAMIMDTRRSNKSALQTMTLEFNLGSNQLYKITKAVVNSATVNFDVDGIATVEWSGMGANIVSVTDGTQITSAKKITEGGRAADTNNFIRNRLTSMSIAFADGGNSDISPINDNAYNLTVTGGSISIENNISYLTPEELGVVNKPIEHVTGVRNIGGSFTCYLATGTGGSREFFDDLVSDAALGVTTHDFAVTFNVGGTTGQPRVAFEMPHCHVEVPSHSIEDVISLETNFSSLQSDMESNVPDDFKMKTFGKALA